MDFVLLLDSPEAGTSQWVMQEITEAIHRRIPVCCVCFGKDLFFPLYRDARRVEWHGSDRRRLEKVRLLVSRGIASRQSLEQRVVRTVATAALRRPVSIASPARRQLLAAAGSHRFLIEYEDAPVSLERLHRLYVSCQANQPCSEAMLVAGDTSIPKLTLDAVEWARGHSPLRVLPLTELYAALTRHFATMEKEKL